MTVAEIDWHETLREVPGALGALLGEIFASEDMEQASRYRNARPKPQNRSVQDVHDALFPTFSSEPFATAIEPLLKPSLRAIADRAGMSHSQLSRFIDGERPLDRYKLELIAKAARVSPGYFLEYRQMVVTDAVAKHIAANPTAGIAAFKAVTRSLLSG